MGNKNIIQQVYEKGKFSDIARNYVKDSNGIKSKPLKKVEESFKEKKIDKIKPTLVQEKESINPNTSSSSNSIIQAYLNNGLSKEDNSSTKEQIIIDEKILNDKLRQLESRLTVNTSLHSGGGSNAKNYANGGIMNGNLTINGDLTVTGNITDELQIKNITSDYQVLSTDDIILADSSANNILITLPDELNKITIKRLDGTTNSLIVSGSQDIDGLNTLNISRQYTSLTLINYGNKFWII